MAVRVRFPSEAHQSSFYMSGRTIFIFSGGAVLGLNCGACSEWLAGVFKHMGQQTFAASGISLGCSML